MSSTIYPIILAAGASRRMGYPKPLLDYRGQSALERIAVSCGAASSARPIVVLGYDKQRIAEEARRLEVKGTSGDVPDDAILLEPILQVAR